MPLIQPYKKRKIWDHKEKKNYIGEHVVIDVDYYEAVKDMIAAFKHKLGRDEKMTIIQVLQYGLDRIPELTPFLRARQQKMKDSGDVWK